MSIGKGIAIAGIWLGVGIAALRAAPDVAAIIAVAATITACIVALS